jgi:predicted permease
MLHRLLDDVRDGLRVLTKSPGLSATAGLLIALVIGGNATVYSILNGAIRSPAPGVTARDIVTFGLVGHPGAPYFSYSDYTHYASQTRTLRSLAAWGFGRGAFETPAGTYLMQVAPITANYFETLGLTLGSGRLFNADDDRPGAPLVAIISDAIWQTRFAGSPAAVGARVSINGRPTTIVGIGPPRFAGPLSGEWTDVWVPLHSYDARALEGDDAVVMIGRLAAGTSTAQVRAEFATLRARLEATSPRTRPDSPTERNCPPQCQRAPVLITPYAASGGGVLQAFEREVLAIFSIITLLTLLIVGANVANLMLARAVVRQRETAVRQSLGASRGRLVRLVLIEGLAISAVAGVFAMVIAAWAASVVPTLLPQSRGTMPIDYSPDWRVAVYAGILSLAATILSSLLPALRTSKHDALPLLKDGAHTTTGGRSRLSRGLVVLQLAFSVLLLTAAGLAYRSGALATTGVGFDTSNVLLVNVGTAAAVQSTAENVLLRDRIRQRLAAIPNVTAATYMIGPWSAWNRADVRTEASANPLRVTQLTVGDGYLETLGTDLVSGRPLALQGATGTGRAAVITRAVAADLFPGTNPVGRTLLIGRERQAVEIVGVVTDAYYTGFAAISPGGPARRPYYLFVADRPGADPAARPDPLDSTTFQMRHSGGLERLVAAIPGVLRDVDPRIALASTRTLQDAVADQAVSSTMISRLLMVFAGMSLLIAGIGQYAVVAFNMRRRTRDFGLRIALGASARQIVGSVLGEGVGLTVVGLVVGFALSVAVATALGSVLFGVTPTDAPTYTAVFVMLACVSLFASYLPARRASRIDPVQALRTE